MAIEQAIERSGAAAAAVSTAAGGTMSDAALRRVLHGLDGVDEVGAVARTASLATRSIKKDAKLWALDAAVRMIDLTTLEGADTPGKVRAMCAKARRPDPADPAVPPVAAVCVYPDLVPVAKAELAGSTVGIASVATAFPSGRASLAVKLADTADAVAGGATEVDMVIDRGAFLAGRYGLVYEEIVAVKQACGDAHLKVILETGELVTLDNVARASWLAMLAGADFIKTSTGKISPASTPPVALVMLTAVGSPGEAKRLWQVEQGALETVQSPIALPRTEACLYAGYGQAMEPRTRGAKSFTHSYGAGDIVLTTKRIIFNGGDKNLAVQLKLIVDFSVYEDGVEVRKATGKPLTFALNAKNP